MAASTRTYEGEMLDNAGGTFISVTEGMKMFIAHEIGHNMVSTSCSWLLVETACVFRV